MTSLLWRLSLLHPTPPIRRSGHARRAIAAAPMMTIMAGLVSAPAFADELPVNRSDMIARLLPTVVDISVERVELGIPATAEKSAVITLTDASPDIKSYGGSGFVIDSSGLIVTNYHVVQDAYEITVTFSDGTRLPAKTLSGTRMADLALVKVEADHPLAAAHWGDSDLLRVGDQVFAAGDPFSIGLSISAGIVSGLNRDIQNSPYDDYVQTDATINHGNSGGPLFDIRGNVIGVDSAIISPTTGSSGLGFALPSNTARFVIDRLRTYGWVRPGWIGIKVQQMTPKMADALGMAQPEGSIVSWVMPGGPAENAGVVIGDVIHRFNGSVPSDERRLLRDIAQTPVGETITLSMLHDGVDRNVQMTAREWPRNQWEDQNAPTPLERPKIFVRPDLGLSLSALEEEQKAKLDFQSGLNGVLVTKVLPYTDPAQQGMVEGDIIMRVQDKPVATPEEVQSRINEARDTKRDFVLMLILPKVRNVPGPKWISLQLGASDR